MRAALLLSLALALGLTSGCRTAEGTLQDGLEAEAAGDLDRAFERYLTALRRADGDLDEARDRAERVGAELVARRLAAAANAPAPPAAADAYVSLDGLAADAQAQGVRLELPASFAADRAAAFDAAIAFLLADGAARTDGGDYAGALAQLDRARPFAPSPDQARALDATARDAHTAWAESDLAAGRFRSALGRAEAALAMTPEGLPELDLLAGLRADILDAGSVVVAFFPLEAPDETQDGGRGRVRSTRTGTPATGSARMPPGFADDLMLALYDDHWGAPPPFILPVEFADVRRMLRREDRDAPFRIDDDRYAAALARDLDADLGVASAVFGYAMDEEERRRRTVRGRTRGGTPATWTRVEMRRTLAASAEYAVVDARSRRVLCQDDVRREVRDTYTVGDYDGDWRDLALGRGDRRLFTEDHREDEEDAHLDELRDRLAEALTDRIFRCLDRQIG